MPQQVYNVGEQNTDLLVKTITPTFSTTTNEAEALEWEEQSEAMAAATYLNSVRQETYVVVGPHPKPKH